MSEERHRAVCTATAALQKSWTSTGHIMGVGEKAFRIRLHCEQWKCVNGHYFRRTRSERIADRGNLNE